VIDSKAGNLFHIIKLLRLRSLIRFPLFRAYPS
jgi:hypothetical protein